MTETSFTFERGRGVVWVCDIRNSSRFLNNNESAHAVEQFFPRLHWLGRVAVYAAGGRFVKWTGDGFLAWFPIELYRELGPQAAKAINICKQLSLINNVTGLGIESPTRFRLNHGITMEHDALLTMVSDDNGEHFDLIGRSVVLAFRLTGIRANFPNIVSQREVVEATEKERGRYFIFRKLNVSAEDRRKYFKGERWGTANLYASAERKPRPRTLDSMLRTVKKTIAEAESPQTIQDETDPTVKQFMECLLSGPAWTQDIFKDYVKYLREDLLGTLKVVVRKLDSPPDKQPP